MRAEVGDFDPVQDEEPRVVDHEGKVLLAQLRRPTDECIARGELPRSGGEAEHGEGPAAPVMYGVADLGADEGLVAEVVVAVFKLKLYDQEVNGLYRGVTGWVVPTSAIRSMPSTMTLTGQIQDND